MRSTARVEQPVKMEVSGDSKKRKHEDEDGLDPGEELKKMLQETRLMLKEGEDRKTKSADERKEELVIGREEEGRRKELEKRERLRLELTRLEKEEKEEKDKMGWIELEKRRMCTNFPRKISEHEIKIRQVESSMKENADKLGALIKQKEKEKVEFEKQIDDAIKEMAKAIKQRNNINALKTESQQKIGLTPDNEFN